jgi:hypothetical protein
VNRLLRIKNFWTAKNDSTFWLVASLGDPKRSISEPFYYYTGSRLGQILHSRLRMQYSSLNQHLYRKNIVDSPNCICGLTESTTHYLFHSPRLLSETSLVPPVTILEASSWTFSIFLWVIYSCYPILHQRILIGVWQMFIDSFR